MHRLFTLALFLLAAVALAPAHALAHANLSRATPAAGSTVSPAPKEVALVFSEKLEPKFSSIEVRDAKGDAMPTGAARVGGSEMRVALKPLPPGTYKVIWRVLSVDTHRTNGSFSFRVGP